MKKKHFFRERIKELKCEIQLLNSAEKFLTRMVEKQIIQINSFAEKESVYKKQVSDLQKELSSLQHDFDLHRSEILQKYEAKDSKIRKLNDDIDGWTDRYNSVVKEKTQILDLWLNVTDKNASQESENRNLQLQIDELETQVEYKDKQYSSLQARFENVLGKQMSDQAGQNKTDVHVIKGKGVFETMGDILMPAAVDNPVMERQENPEYGSKEWLHGKIEPPKSWLSEETNPKIGKLKL